MSHIDGHISDPGGSFGTLTLDADPTITISFLPPPFQIKSGDPVGFHPIYNNNHTEILAFNITLGDMHDVAEQMVIQKLGGITRIEEIHNMPNKKAGVQLMMADMGHPQAYRDVWKDVLNYFNYTDFKTFYINSAGKANASYAIKHIKDFYHTPVTPVAANGTALKKVAVKGK